MSVKFSGSLALLLFVAGEVAGQDGELPAPVAAAADPAGPPLPMPCESSAKPVAGGAVAKPIAPPCAEEASLEGEVELDPYLHGLPSLKKLLGPTDPLRPAFSGGNRPRQLPDEPLASPEESNPGKAFVAEDRYVRFARPAHFPVPRANAAGQGSPRAALIISEGMAIRVQKEGQFTVRMVVETMPTDIDLRLQFQLLSPAVVAPAFAPATPTLAAGPILMAEPMPESLTEIGTVTLPVIRFRPSSDQKASMDPILWQVEQQGYSPLLKAPDCGRCGGKSPLTIIRKGSIDIGSAPRTTLY